MSAVHHWRFVAIVATLVALTSGCQPLEAPVPPLPEKDMDQWVLPLDTYLPPYFEAQYARQLLMRACMDRAGFEFRVAPVDIDEAPPETSNSSGRRLFDVDLASRYGYHFAPSQRVDRRLAQEIAATQYSTIEQRQLDDCIRSAQAKLGAPSDSLADWLGFTVDVTSDPDVMSSVGSWAACLHARFPGDGTGWPEDMPGERRGSEFGLDRATEWDADPPSDEEIALAVADAECRDSSGFREAYYSAEWNAQLVLIENNRRDLGEEYVRNEAYRRRTLATIDELG